MRRCKACILPETFPKIKFDIAGLCQYCLRNIGVLEEKAEALPSFLVTSNRILVGLSGGKDSTYGTALLAETCSAEIITFTYDWPLVNKSARENAARLVSLLDLEHVVRAPDSFKQIKFIRRVVSALAKHPDPRVIPLLLAPDKFFFSEAKKVAYQYEVDYIVFCAGNPIEFTDFKSLVSGGKNTSGGMLNLNFANSLKLLLGFFSSYLKNPRLFLAGISLPIRAFILTYWNRPKIVYLFDYVQWDQDKIEDTKLIFGWTGEQHFANRDWRSGDGSSEFYNYLYRTIFGFDERTCYLANKVRSGLITRDEAIRQEESNKEPNIFRLKEYASVIGFNLDEFLRQWHFNLKKKSYFE